MPVRLYPEKIGAKSTQPTNNLARLNGLQRRTKFVTLSFVLSRLPICAAVVLCASATAQDSDLDQWGALRQLNAGQKVQIVQITLESQTAIFQRLSDEAIFFRVDQQERSVTRQNLLRLTVIDRSKRRRNIVLGLVIGTAAGLAGGGAVVSAAGLFDEGTGSKPGLVIFGFGAGGAVAGYAMGASSGTRTIYRKRGPNAK